MNKSWTTEDLKTLRSELMFKRDLHEVAAVLNRPVDEVEEIARDLGWITSPPFTPDESKCVTSQIIGFLRDLGWGVTIGIVVLLIGGSLLGASD